MKNNLQFLLEKNHVSITKIARELQVSRTSIYRLLDGKNPSAQLMLKIATYFNKDASDIFFNHEVQHVVRCKKNKSA